MQPNSRNFIKRWLITTLAVLVASNTVRGIKYDDLTSLFLASLLLGIFNAILRPILFFLSLPLLLVTLGLFTLVINAALLYLVGWVLKGFHVASFSSAFWGSLTISIFSIITNVIIGKDPKAVPPPPASNTRRPPSDDGGGPIIDV